MMSEKIPTYEADLDQEYITLTDKHKNIKDELEKAILEYLETGKSKPVTVQGPYGSGKTQLLYYLFKFTYEKGGIGIYTHLEKIIPPEEMKPSEYADYLRDLVNEEVRLLKEGKSKLMSGKVADYAVGNIGDNTDIILFVDEIEQQYRLLDEKVKTNDHSPMREVIARVNRGEAGFYLILAFAPVSFYEFSKGEAQTRRYLPVVLPIVKPKTSREYFGEIGNLVWWMGRGRYGWMLRIYDMLKANVSNTDEISKKELQSVCLNIGSIGGVNVLEFEMIERIDDFSSFRDFLVPLGPKEEGNEMYAGNTRVIKRCLIYNNEKRNLEEVIGRSLREIGVSKITDISYYFLVILDGLSTSDSEIPLFIDPDDWRELSTLVEELILEFEGENRLPSEDLKLFQDKASDFSYHVRRTAEDLGKLTEGYCITPEYLHTLFPFPTSSPNLIPDKKLTEQRENLADQTYLAREESDGISIFFFLNEDKIRNFLVQEIKKYLKETKVLVAVNLGSGKVIEKPRLAQWLEREKRLKIITPPTILSDFLVSFYYWVRNKKGESLPIYNLFKKLKYYQSKSEKNEARKISYYNSRIEEYLKSELPEKPHLKYILRDKAGFDEFKAGRVGFVPEILGFSFVDNKNDWRALYDFRKEFESTRFIRKVSTDKKTGVPSAVEKVIVTDKRGDITMGAVLKRVRDSFSDYLSDLDEVVNETSKDEFKEIPSDDDSKPIFEGIYLYLREWKDPSKAEEVFRDAKSKWEKLKNRIDELSKKINGFEKLTDKNILLTHPLKVDEDKITNIAKILNANQAKISPYTKFLLSKFIEKTVEVAEPKLDEIEKRFFELRDSLKDKIEEYKAAFDNLQEFDNDTFAWIGKEKEEIQEEVKQKFEEICQNLTKGGKIDLGEIPDTKPFVENIKGIIEELQMLDAINESIKKCKKIAQKINEKLREWG